MTQFSVSVKGDKLLLESLAKIENPEQVCDSVFTEVSNQTMRNLVIGSQGKGQIKTGNTARAWVRNKKGPSSFSLDNDAKSLDGKHLIANVLNFGHGEILPVRAKKLRIPLTERGVNRGKGYKKSGAVMGVDFIFADRVRPVSGTEFIDKEKERASVDLINKILVKIKGVFGGK